MEISEKEFAVIREISSNDLPDQRMIALKTGYSLGLTNLIIKRLVKKGYIKAKQLNRKKIRYLLTPKGLSGKAKKSYSYALKTVNIMRMIRKSIDHLVLEEYRKGANFFEIIGSGELSNIAELTFKNIGISDITCQRQNVQLSDKGESFLIVHSKQNGSKSAINLMEYVSGQDYFGID